MLLALLLGQLGLLMLVLLAWQVGWWRLTTYAPGGLLQQVFPVIVPWAGAVGGATNAIRGLVANWRRYADTGGAQSARASAHRLRWNAWALLQPVLGAVYGSIAVLIVALVLGTLGSADKLDTSANGQLMMMVVAFIVGYRQKTFHDLVTRSVNVLFGPGDPASDNDEGGTGTVSITVDPTELSLETGPQQPTSGTVTITNLSSSIIPKDQILLTLKDPTPHGSTALRADPPTANVGAGGSAAIDVHFDPGTEPGPFTAVLDITCGPVTRTVSLKGTVT
ncbi:MAG TPA: hypothetical protein VIT41_10045 [Microlunatus sp.]